MKQLPIGRISPFAAYARNALMKSRIRDDRLLEFFTPEYVWWVQNFAQNEEQIRLFVKMCKLHRNEEYKSTIVTFYVDEDVARYVKRQPNHSRAIKEIYHHWRKENDCN